MIVDIRDQLGNQLFTYASLKSVCMRTDQPFRWFSNGTDIINSTDSKLGNSIDGGAFPNINMEEKIPSLDNPIYDWVEPWPRKSNYLPEVFKINSNELVRGHFQTEKYFSWNRKNVLDWFALNSDLQKKALKKLELIKESYPNCKTVSVHLRRGWDYAREGRMLNLGYYRDSMQRLMELTGNQSKNMVALVFSDIEVKNNFQKYLRCNMEIVKGSLFEDFALMKICDYHIISNSTFAWWAAWLDEKENFVCRPSIYPISHKSNYPEDIFPDNWIKVSAKVAYSPLKIMAGKALRYIKKGRRNKS